MVTTCRKGILPELAGIATNDTFPAQPGLAAWIIRRVNELRGFYGLCEGARRSVESPDCITHGAVKSLFLIKHRWSNEFDPTVLIEQGRNYSANNLLAAKNKLIECQYEEPNPLPKSGQ